MGKDKREFFVGDRVFAKVRGYPPWPARVQEVVNPGTRQVRYSIFFYGTYERATLKPEDVFAYEQNKERFGMPQKRRFFNEGMDEIENQPFIQGPPQPATEVKTPSSKPVKAVPRFTQPEDSEEEGKLVIDEEERRQKKRKLAESIDMEAALKKVKRSQPSLKTSPSPEEPVQISRSGRKIKPKRFDDDFASLQNSKGGSRHDEFDDLDASYKKTQSLDELSEASSPSQLRYSTSPNSVETSDGSASEVESEKSTPQVERASFMESVENKGALGQKGKKTPDSAENGDTGVKSRADDSGSKAHTSGHEKKMKPKLSATKNESRSEEKPKIREKKFMKLICLQKLNHFLIKVALIGTAGDQYLSKSK